MTPGGGRAGPRGRAGRVGCRDRRRRDRATSSACPTASSSTASRCAARSPRSYAATDPRSSITGNFRDTWGGRNLNQADHIAVGRAVLDAVRDAGNRWVFPEQLDGDLEPWGGVGAVWAFGSPQSGHAVDTTDTFDAGVASLEAHRAYIDGLGWEHFDPREFLEGMAPADRAAARGRPRGAVRGVPDGLGRVARPTSPGATTSGPGSVRRAHGGAAGRAPTMAR